MSLKWFHVVFIAISTLTGVGVGVWGLFSGFPVLGVGALVSSAALCAYGSYFLQKARRMGLA